MRPLGQRVAPKNAKDLPANAYANGAFDVESGEKTHTLQ